MNTDSQGKTRLKTKDRPYGCPETAGKSHWRKDLRTEANGDRNYERLRGNQIITNSKKGEGTRGNQVRDSVRGILGGRALACRPEWEVRREE